MRKVAPNFQLPDQNGTTRSLIDYRGRWVVLYFYPNDRSLNCTKQACHFRDEYKVIRQFGNAEVIGINPASVKSHQRFSKRHSIRFPLLSDPGHHVTSAFGAWRSNKAPILIDKIFGTRRNTYLIDPKGNIAKSYLGVDPNTHAEIVISDLQELQSS